MKELLLKEAEKKQIENEIKLEKKKEHNRFYKENKKFFIFMDIVVILTILMNFGALTLTNIMVAEPEVKALAKEGKELKLYEANPVTAKIHNFKGVDDLDIDEEQKEEERKKAKGLINRLVYFGLYWAILITLYIYYRLNIYTMSQLMWLWFVVAFYFMVLGKDFINNVGYYLPKIWWGI